MRRLLAGNNGKERIFKEIYLEYYAPMCIYARRFIDDKAVCEDVVTDVFASLWKNRDNVTLTTGSAVPYLKTATRNSCLNYLKHQQYEINYAEMVRKREPVYSTVPDTIYSADELRSMLWKILERMPEEHRQVFIMSYFDGKQQEEIARELNVSVKSVGRYKKIATSIVENELKDISY